MLKTENTFKNGLLMDFNPTIQPNTTLTNALNATFVTFNGNEGSLLNDMGNGRVETAFLPEGFIPVGTTVFGGIIYIVSYNPLNDLCLIGCFPSPERNIASDEISEITSEEINNATFLELDGYKNPTGKLKTFTKLVLIREDALNPGDKYLIYTENNQGSYSVDLWNAISGLGKEHSNIKLHIVSIQESGKIVYLDSTAQFYNVNNEFGESASFLIPAYKKDSFSLKEDIDTYREKVANNYSVFSERISGKLAILAELEIINTFNCGHKVKTVEFTKNGESYIRYDVLINYNWESESNSINPAYLCVDNIDWEFAEAENYIYDDVNDVYKYNLSNYKLELHKSNSINDLFIGTINNGILRTTLPSIKEEHNVHYELKLDLNYSLNSFYGDITPKLMYSKTYVNNENDLIYARFLRANKVDTDFNNVNTLIPVNNENTIFKIPENYKSSDLWDDSESIFNSIGSGILAEDLKKDIPVVAVTKALNEGINSVYYRIPDDYINNNLKYNCEFLLCSIEFPKDIAKNFLMKYTITPAMTFGKLEHLSVANSINFSKINTDSIDIVEWRYYVPSTGQFLDLEFTNDLYEKEGERVTEMAIEFYDWAGYVGAYVFSNFDNYNGKINHKFPLNIAGTLNYAKIKNNKIFHQKYYTKDLKISDCFAQKDPDNLYWYHNVRTLPDDLVPEKFKNTSDEISYQLEYNINSNCFEDVIKDDNDMGILYSNMFYLCNIWYKYQLYDINGDILENMEPRYHCISKYINASGYYNKYYTNFGNIDFDNIYHTIPIKLGMLLEEISEDDKVTLANIKDKSVKTILDEAVLAEDIKKYVEDIDPNKVEFNEASNKLEITTTINTKIKLKLHIFPTVEESLQKYFAFSKKFEDLSFPKHLGINIYALDKLGSSDTSNNPSSIVLPFNENTEKLDVIGTNGKLKEGYKKDDWNYEFEFTNEFENKFEYSNFVKKVKTLSKVEKVYNKNNADSFGLEQRPASSKIVFKGSHSTPYGEWQNHATTVDRNVDYWEPEYWYDLEFLTAEESDGNGYAAVASMNTFPEGSYNWYARLGDSGEERHYDPAKFGPIEGKFPEEINLFLIKHDYFYNKREDYYVDASDYFNYALQKFHTPFEKNELFKICGINKFKVFAMVHVEGDTTFDENAGLEELSDKALERYYFVPKNTKTLTKSGAQSGISWEQIAQVCGEFLEFYTRTYRKSGFTTRNFYTGNLNTTEKVTMLTQLFTECNYTEDDCKLEDDFAYLGRSYTKFKESIKTSYKLINKNEEISETLIPNANCINLKLNTDLIKSKDKDQMLTFILDEIIIPKLDLTDFNTMVVLNDENNENNFFIDKAIETNGFYLPVIIDNLKKLLLINNSLILNIISNVSDYEYGVKESHNILQSVRIYFGIDDSGVINTIDEYGNELPKFTLFKKCFPNWKENSILVSDDSIYRITFEPYSSHAERTAPNYFRDSDEKAYKGLRISEYCELTPDDIIVGDNSLDLALEYDKNNYVSVTAEVKKHNGSATFNKLVIPGVGW